MKKFLTKIIGASLAIAMMIGVGAGVNAAKPAKEVNAAITSSEQSGLAVLTSSNFDTDAEYVLKSTDGYYWNGVSGTSSNKWGGITKTLAQVARVTLDGTWANGFTIKDASNNYLRATTGNMTWATTSPGTFKMGTDSASHPIVLNGSTNGLKVNGTSGMRLYTNLTYNENTGKSVALYKIPEPITLSSIALSGDYQTQFTVGDTFNHDGMVVTATYSNNSTANVTTSATWSGYNMATAGNQTVTVSYEEENITKTATYQISVVAPSSPYISPETDSINAATGQEDEVISFTYGNVNSGDIEISSDNTSVVHISSYDCDAGEGLVQIGFGAAGTANILFEVNNTTLATIAVEVIESVVTITGLPATRTIYVGDTPNFASMITVNAAGICSNNVTWESDDEDVATVSSAGVVTAVANGSANITVTSVDYPSATMTCAVTVKTLLNAIVDLSVVSANSVSDELMVWNVADKFTMQIAKNTSAQNVTNYYPGSGNSSTRFYSNQILTLTPSPLGVTAVKAVFAATTESYATTFAGSSFTNATAARSDADVTVTFTNGTEAALITVGGTCGFTSVTFYYEQGEINSPQPYMALTETIKTISGTETPSNQATNKTITFSDIYDSDTNFTSTTSGQLTIAASKASGSSDPKYYGSNGTLRIYTNNTLTISAVGNISQITFTTNQGNTSSFTLSSGSLTSGVWTGSATSVTFTNTGDQIRITDIEVDYQEVSVSVSNVALRIGGSIPTSAWTSINSSWTISDYGIIFVRQSMMTARGLTTAEAVFRHDEDDVGKVNVMSSGSFRNPQAIGDNYVFTARLTLDEEDYDEVFYAAPFIVAGGQYYFFPEEHDSVRTIANRCYTNGGSSLSQLALATLKGNN